MQYQWHYGPADVSNINQMTDVVTQVHWYCLGTAPNGTTYKASGSVSLGTPTPSTFVPFNQLTQAQVQNWVTSHVNQNFVQDTLANEYTASLTPPVKPFNF